MIEKRIESLFKSLSSNEKMIAEYIIKNKNKIGEITSTKLAEEIGVGQSSVIKFIKKIGFVGYVAFKLQLERDLENEKKVEKNKIHSDICLEDTLKELTQKTLLETVQALEDTIGMIDYKNFETIIEKIKMSEQILIIGSGMSSIVARDLELKLMKIKKNSMHYDSKQMQLMKLATMNEKDLVIAISHRGETQEVIDVIKEAKKINIEIISITSVGKNTVSTLSDYNLGVVSKEGVFRSSAISSRMAQMILLDSIFLRLVQKDYKRIKNYIDKSKKIVGWVK
ncbi:MurR/RpiR family transcriptional regulator [Cetobacterium sp. 8H]|uniref:MurR/RpiR family transcriptional regulator n=1 Tax=Cetobacterium sp. 8H TaxID=2759681 RepID=UPI00163C8C20|nr:MurR/RpiR family transcriptional regulator [Cetobacterium sp. 8H]MBC2850114.1 MurR/RpiR family transcriptional regulator [Cetobacterium sp. 8H]